MPHLTLRDALREATPAACRSLLAKGIRFAVAVETAAGEWVLLHADSEQHATELACVWIDYFGSRGASIWPLHENGIAQKHIGLIQPDFITGEVA